MKIIVTKDEFARLVRECESKFNTSSCCYNCIMNTFCQGEGRIEDFCEIEIMGTVEQNKLREFCYTGTPPMNLRNDTTN